MSSPDTSTQPVPLLEPSQAMELAGENVANSLQDGQRYSLRVSNKAGYLSHVDLQAEFECAPETIFNILTNSNNCKVLRDIKEVRKRDVLSDRDGVKVVEVHQVSELRILWRMHQMVTALRVTEDTNNLSITFELLHSEAVDKFSGKWELSRVRHPDGRVTTNSHLLQDVLPKGVPSFASRVPLLGRILRGVSVRAITRLLEDLQAVIKRVQSGESLDLVLAPDVLD